MWRAAYVSPRGRHPRCACVSAKRPDGADAGTAVPPAAGVTEPDIPENVSISSSSSSTISPPNDKLLIIDGPRYDGSTIVASLEDGLAYPNPNQDFHNSTVWRRDRVTRASKVEDHWLCLPACSVTWWVHGMWDVGGVIITYTEM